MDEDLFMQLGIDPMKVLLELLIFGLPFTILCVWATTRVTRRLSGSQATFWLFFIWIVPVLGPIFALIATRKAPQKIEPDADP